MQLFCRLLSLSSAGAAVVGCRGSWCMVEGGHSVTRHETRVITDTNRESNEKV